MTHIIPLTKIGFFNPGRLSDEEVEQSFIARIPFFEFIFKKVVAEKPNSIPQHHLIIGQRGMGKSSLLIRIAVELRKSPYNEAFIPLSFPEEQYNVDRLSKFWLNCLDSLADALDKENKKSDLATLDMEISTLSKEKALDANIVYAAFHKWVTKIKRRPVLLVDNLNLIFSKIDQEEQHQLRAILMSNGAPILVGASTTSIDETVNYKAPFYDAFQINYLKKLTFQESIDVLINLAKITGNTNFENNVYLQKGRLEALYQLTGGTPRTLAILFPLIQDGFSENIQTDLDALLDAVTPLYKARFEELPGQLQVVMDAVALNWDPINLERLREVTMLENPQLSPQLKRLVDVGWLQKLDAYKAKGGAYEVSERFFNVWYLMRRSSRRQKRELYCLTKFLESFYGNDLNEIARARITCKSENANHIALDLALADAVKEKELSEKLRNKGYNALIDMSFKNKAILNNFTVPDKFTQNKIEELFDEADINFKEKRYTEAELSLLTLLKVDENNTYAWYNLGFLYDRHLNKYEEAEIAYKKAIELDKKLSYAFSGLGDLYRTKSNKYYEAEKAYKQAIKLNKKDANAWAGLGDLYRIHLSKYSEAEFSYKTAINLDAKDISTWNGLGNLYSANFKKYEEAEKAYKQAIKLNSEIVAPWINLGNIYKENLGKYTEAEEAYKKAIELDGRDSNLWGFLGKLYSDNLNKYEEAEMAYKRSIELDETNSYPWNYLGSLYANHFGKYIEAEVAYKKAIELDGEDAYLWNSLGNLYSDYLEKYVEAEIAYKKAISLDAKDAYPWDRLGDLYSDNLGKYAEAENAYKKAIELDKNYIYSYIGLGNLLQDFLGKYKEAELAYRKALEADKETEIAKYNLIFLLRDKLDKFSDAKELFNSLKGSDEVKDSYLLNNALFAYYEKNIGMAESFLKEALVEVGDSLPSNTRDDWYRSAAVIVKLGFGDSLLNVFESTGHDVIFRPLYIAVKALTEEEDVLFLNSIAAEVREPAKKIMEIMKNYIR
jgi:tetratricopeptide (TPR) repeat protein